MKYSMKAAALLSASLALTTAQELEKPALTSNLDYLLDGNANSLPAVTHQASLWPSGSIPQDCKDLGEGEGHSASDFEVYDVTFDDCADPWLFCRHKEVEVDIDTAAETFSKIPVAMRDWVRQVLLLPGGNSAFAINGNVAFIGTTGENVDVMLHETGHGIDGFAAFGENLSTGDGFLAAYDADTHVPDDYARSSQAENVAQNIVVAVYDSNVPGGFPGIQDQYTAIQNQYSYIKDLGGDALVPGGTCNRHLENSETVTIGSTTNTTSAKRSRVFRGRSTGFKGDYDHIVRDFVPFEHREAF
ncbi:hypothetical protein BDV19DRAFT_370550 [Aspergillus venezuelensis]